MGRAAVQLARAWPWPHYSRCLWDSGLLLVGATGDLLRPPANSAYLFRQPFTARTAFYSSGSDKSSYPARALRALGLLLADGAPTVGRGKTF